VLSLIFQMVWSHLLIIRNVGGLYEKDYNN
jgi:hypothetical protein